MDFEQGQLGNLDGKNKVPCHLPTFRLEKSHSTSPLCPLQVAYSFSPSSVLLRARRSKSISLNTTSKRMLLRGSFPAQTTSVFFSCLKCGRKIPIVPEGLSDGLNPEVSSRRCTISFKSVKELIKQIISAYVLNIPASSLSYSDT